METRGGRVHHAYGRCAPYIRNSRTIHAVPMHHHPRFCCSLGAAYACRSASVTRPIYVFIRFALYSNAPSRSMYVYFFCFNSDASIRMMILVSVIRAFCLDDFIIDIMYNKSIHFLDNMQYKKMHILCIYYKSNACYCIYFTCKLGIHYLNWK